MNEVKTYYEIVLSRAVSHRSHAIDRSRWTAAAHLTADTRRRRQGVAAACAASSRTDGNQINRLCRVACTIVFLSKMIYMTGDQDGQTDGPPVGHRKYRASIASRGKNYIRSTQVK